MKVAPPDLGKAPEEIAELLDGAALTPAWRRDDGTVTVWQAGFANASSRYLKVEAGLEAEARRLRWLAGRIPAPRVLEFGIGSDGVGWLLTEGLPGVQASDPRGEDARRVIDVLGETLRSIHSLDPAECPFWSPVEFGLEDVERHLGAGFRRDCWHPVRRRWLPADEVLDELRERVPEPLPGRVIHGDYCLPNVLLQNGRLTGVLDVGYLGLGDPGRDFVSVDASGRRNLGTEWDLDRFYSAYGERPDPERVRWFTLLRALLWR